MDSSQILMLCARLSSIISNKEIEDFDRAVHILWRLYRIVPDIIAVDDLGGLIQNVLICRVLSRVANTSIDRMNDATRSEIRDEIVKSFMIPEDAQLSESSSVSLARTFATCSRKLILLATDENWDRVQCRDAILFQSDSLWQHIYTSINDYVKRVTETVNQSRESSTSSFTSKENPVNAVTSKENSTSSVKSKENSMSSVTSKENSTRSVKSKENSTRSAKSKENSLSSVTSKENLTRSVKFKENSMNSVTSKENFTSTSKENSMSLTKDVYSDSEDEGELVLNPFPYKFLMKREYCYEYEESEDSDSEEDDEQNGGHCSSDSNWICFPIANFGNQRHGPISSDSDLTNGTHPSNGDQRDGCIMASDGEQTDGPIPSNGDERHDPITSDGDLRNGPISCRGDRTNGLIPRNSDPSGDPITTYSKQSDGYNRSDRSDLSSDTDHTYIFEKYDENITVIPESPRSTCEGPALFEDFESPLLFSSEKKKDDVGNANKVEKDLNTAEKVNNGTINLAGTFFFRHCDKVGDDDTHVMIKRLAAAEKPKSVETANDCNEVNETNFVEEVVNDLQIAQNHSKGLQTKYLEYPESVTTTNNNSNKATGTIEQTSNFQDMALFLDIAASLLNEKEDNEPEDCVDVGEQQIPERSLDLVEENSELWEGTGKNPVDSDFLEWMKDNYDPANKKLKVNAKPSSDNNIEFPEEVNPIEAMDKNNKSKNGNKSVSNENNTNNHINRETENTISLKSNDHEAIDDSQSTITTACSVQIPPNDSSDWRMRIDKKQGRVAHLIGKLQKLRNLNNLANQKSLNVLVNTDKDDATAQDDIPLLFRKKKSRVLGVNRAHERSGNGVNFANQILRCDVVNSGKNKRKSDIPWLVSKRKKRVGVNRARRKIRNGGNLGKNKRSFEIDIRRRFRRKKKRVHANISQKRASEFECRVDLKNSYKPVEGSQKNCRPMKLDQQLNKQDSLKDQEKCATPSPPKVEIKKESIAHEALCNHMENLPPNKNKLEFTLETRDRQRGSAHSVTKTENLASYLASCDEGDNKESTVKKISCSRSGTIQPDKTTNDSFHQSNNRSQASFQNILHDYSYSANDETRLHVKRKRRSKRSSLFQASKTEKNSCEEQQNSAFIASPKTNIQTNGFQNYSNRITEPFCTVLQDKGSQQKVSNSISNGGILPKKEVLNWGDKSSPEDSIRSPIDILNADCNAQSNRILPQPNDIFVKKSAKTPNSETPSTRVSPLTPIPPSQFYSSPPSIGSSIQLSCSSSEDERRSARSPSIFELSGLNSKSSLGGYTSGKLEWNLSPSTEECSPEPSKSLHVVEVTKRDTLDFIKNEPVEIDSNLSSSHKDCFEVKGNEQAYHEQSIKSKALATKGHLYASESLSKNQRHLRRRLGLPVCQCSRLKDPSEMLHCNGNKRLRAKSKSELHVQSSTLRNRQRGSSLSKGRGSEEEQNSEVPSSEGTSSEVLSSLEPSSENQSSEELSSDITDSDTSDSDVDDDDDDDPSYSDPYSGEEENSKEESADDLPYHKLSSRRFHIAVKKRSESSSSKDFVTVENDYLRPRLAGRSKRRRTMKLTGNSVTEDGDRVTVAKDFRRGVLMDAVVYVVKL